ncbi:hypothetical protein PNEG_02670 [Pneumocystis murina B123]|uniref:Spindle pole body component n=1 Tax=Pneumocystis murina (strain B123) TaxID=1069680 RepID=M7NP53_PNEMU|nr:hypothetical protein PNEG_02670 [Pneumocystis murina B123]EMR08886.1 hypothetical protein PNEG_02670 [Pneumocystis murina B123]
MKKSIENYSYIFRELEIEKKIEKDAKLIKKIDFKESINRFNLFNNIDMNVVFDPLYGKEPFGSDLISSILLKKMSKNNTKDENIDNLKKNSDAYLIDKKKYSNDIWLEDFILSYPKEFTWNTFKESGSNPYRNPFITEKPMNVFDLFLVKELNHIYSPNEAGIMVDPFLLYESLIFLSLGESSSLFIWDKKHLRFSLSIENLRVTGCTKETTKDIIDFFLSIGTHTFRLQLFKDAIQENALNYDSSVLAFVSCITEILKEYNDILVLELNNINEPLLLLRLIHKYVYIEENLGKLAKFCFRDLENFPEPPFLEIKQGIELLNALYAFVYEDFHINTGNISSISRYLLKCSSQPWLETLEQWIGLQKITPNNEKIWKKKRSGFFIHETDISYLENNVNLNECFKMDNINCLYLPKSFFEDAYNTGKAIRLLYKIQPNHPLCRVFYNREVCKINIQLEWKYKWENINDLTNKINIYKKAVMIEIEKFENSNEYNETVDLKELKKSDKKFKFEFFEYSKQKIINSIKNSINLFESEIENNISPFNKNINEACFLEDIAPIDIIPIHCFIIPLSIQSNLVNNSLVKLFLKNIGLKLHLSLLWKAKLFNDGLFILKLSYALFGSTLGYNKYSLELNCKSRLKGKWPPRPTELTIALQTVLFDTFGSKFLLSKQEFGTESILIGGLSFSIEEMNESEHKKIEDPYNIEALDFLKIVYTPTFPLDEIITDSCLVKYDQLTKFLLRLIRINDIIIKLFGIKANKKMSDYFKITLGFRFHAYHFIRALFFYIFNISLSSNYQGLKKYFKDIELNLSHFTLTSLTHFHLEILDQICFSCFLGPSQTSLAHIITNIFSIILEFSKTFFQYQFYSDIIDKNSLIFITNTLYPSLIEQITKFIEKICDLAKNKGIYTDLIVLFDTEKYV